MSLFFLLYIVSTIFFVLIIGFILRAKKRTVLIAVPVTAIGVPVILVGLLFAFKAPIQQGKIFKNTTLGPLLNLVSPPPDLYNPLASIELEPEKTEYILLFSHRYIGNHALMVSSSKPVIEKNPKYDDIAVSFSVFGSKEEVYITANEKPGQFWGRNDYGAFLASYKVPKDLPTSKQLTATVIISGNLKGFLERRGKTVLKTQKFSDE